MAKLLADDFVDSVCSPAVAWPIWDGSFFEAICALFLWDTCIVTGLRVAAFAPILVEFSIVLANYSKFLWLSETFLKLIFWGAFLEGYYDIFRLALLESTFLWSPMIELMAWSCYSTSSYGLIAVFFSFISSKVRSLCFISFWIYRLVLNGDPYTSAVVKTNLLGMPLFSVCSPERG